MRRDVDSGMRSRSGRVKSAFSTHLQSEAGQCPLNGRHASIGGAPGQRTFAVPPQVEKKSGGSDNHTLKGRSARSDGSGREERPYKMAIYGHSNCNRRLARDRSMDFDRSVAEPRIQRRRKLAKQFFTKAHPFAGAPKCCTGDGDSATPDTTQRSGYRCIALWPDRCAVNNAGGLSEALHPNTPLKT